MLGSAANLDHVGLLGHSRALDGRRLFAEKGRDWTTTPADLATSASQAVNPVVRRSARPSVLSASHAVHPVGVRQHVEGHQSKDKEHNHGAHDPHDAHFGFLSVLFILVWHPFLLNYDLTVCPHFLTSRRDKVGGNSIRFCLRQPYGSEARATSALAADLQAGFLRKPMC